MERLQALLKLGRRNEYQMLNDEEDRTKTVNSSDVEVLGSHSRVSCAPQKESIKAFGCMCLLQTIFFMFSLSLLSLAYITRYPVHGGCLDREYIHCKSQNKEIRP